MEPTAGTREPLWYKDAVIYELHVRAFFDSNGDGIGDFRGLTSKLDYLHDLGVTALWLLPFYPSPLRDDGYDIADYTSIHPSYGTLRDFRVFLREAHARGLRVITELVINHTSDQHPWFQRARQAPPGSVWRDFYVWSDTPEKYQDARIIFKDFELSNWSWDPVAKAYFWHRFYHHQPDLNFDNPRVWKAITQVLDFWLDMGVDGLRLDAIPYLYEREGTNCENLPETHEALRRLRRHVDEHYADRMLLAEANQWPEDTVAYFGNGDECHMAFHFPVMPRMFMAIRMEDRYPIIDVMSQTPPIPEQCQWALFLRNHDELTLEMVTDEERDYMYRMYAQDPEARINLGIRRRLAPLLGNHRRRIELMNGLLLSLPGTPVLYYGDEIGMGDNIYIGDRNGVRTPMQWSGDRNAGFSRANPQRLYLPVIIDPEYHYQAIQVEAQQSNPHSLLWWMKRLIALRKQYRAFGRGTIEFLYPENRKVLAFVRRYDDEHILVVANLSRFPQPVVLNLSQYQGRVPVELFGRVEFTPITGDAYALTLGPHSFFWFVLEPARVVPEELVPVEYRVPTLPGARNLTELLQGNNRARFLSVLPNYLRARRWFGGKARVIQKVLIADSIPMVFDRRGAMLLLVRVEYTEGDPELYMLPVAFAHGEGAVQARERHPQAVIADVATDGAAGGAIIYDPLWDEQFASALLDAIARRRQFRGQGGELVGVPAPALRAARGRAGFELPPNVSQAEQSNTSITYGDHLILKLYRRLGEGINPDLEIGRFLTEKTTFQNVPAVAGYLEFRQAKGEPQTIAFLQRFVPNEGDAWTFTLDSLGRYLEDTVTRGDGQLPELPETRDPLVLAEQPVPELAVETMSSYLDTVQLLGQRTGEMHVALASDRRNPSFAPEPFSAHYQRSIYQSVRSQANSSFRLLRRQLASLPVDVQGRAERFLARENDVQEALKAVLRGKLDALRIRCHGDYHLGQVLYTGTDFIIIDFEGEPARSLSARRIKVSPLRDVAGMLRSFQYAAATVPAAMRERGALLHQMEAVEAWAEYWHTWATASFLRSYLETARPAGLLPGNAGDVAILLEVFLLEKALYELQYELNNRPSWARIPLDGLLQLLGESRTSAVVHMP